VYILNLFFNLLAELFPLELFVSPAMLKRIADFLEAFLHPDLVQNATLQFGNIIMIFPEGNARFLLVVRI
jgi:hypothetical protein